MKRFLLLLVAFILIGSSFRLAADILSPDGSFNRRSYSINPNSMPPGAFKRENQDDKNGEVNPENNGNEVKQENKDNETPKPAPEDKKENADNDEALSEETDIIYDENDSADVDEVMDFDTALLLVCFVNATIALGIGVFAVVCAIRSKKAIKAEETAKMRRNCIIKVLAMGWLGMICIIAGLIGWGLTVMSLGGVI